MFPNLPNKNPEVFVDVFGSPDHLLKMLRHTPIGDEYLDYRIAELFDLEIKPSKNLDQPDSVELKNGEIVPCPAFTTSLDAALSLMPNNVDYVLGHTNAGLTVHAQVGSPTEHYASTLPLAVCLAAMIFILEEKQTPRFLDNTDE